MKVERDVDTRGSLGEGTPSDDHAFSIETVRGPQGTLHDQVSRINLAN